MRIENIRNNVVWELLTILLVFAGLLFSYEVFSRDGVSQGSIVFDPMVITPTRTEMSSADLPYSIENIDLQSNLSQTIFRTVPEALRYEPGVMVQKTGHGQGSPYIRGFTGFRTLYLIDGIRLNNSVFLDGPNQYLNTVDPFSLSHLNALAESKNASVVRKTFGYSYIEQHWSDELNLFNREHLNPFLNDHRPCYFPTLITDEKGKQRKKYHYDQMMTPYEKLKSMDNAKEYLKESLSFEQLDKEAYKISDNKVADEMNLVKKQLFKQIYEQKNA